MHRNKRAGTEGLRLIYHGVDPDRFAGGGDLSYEELARDIAEDEYGGFVTLPLADDLGELSRVAGEIRRSCEVLVVLGIGGSNLGFQAALSFIGSGEGSPEVLFAGNNLSSAYHRGVAARIEDREVCFLVISKSGETLETRYAFELFYELLRERYGNDAAGRVYAITGESGTLRKMAEQEGFTTLLFPGNVGGRYSVLSAVGLLPMLVCGIDAEAVLAGARHAMGDDMQREAMRLAAARAGLAEDKLVEVIETYEPDLHYFSAWLKQLYGESEGKQGKGLMPVSIDFTTELHSMGQYLQDGRQFFFETSIKVLHPKGKFGKMNELNAVVNESVIRAHRSTNISIIEVVLNDTLEFSFGNAVYFFESVAAYTGKLIGVNPFDQPGVEAYKSEVAELLKNVEI